MKNLDFKKIFFVFSAVLFLTVNSVFFLFEYWASGNILKESALFAQIFILNFLISFLFSSKRKINFLILFLLNFFHFSLFSFYLVTYSDLDFNFLKNSFKDIYPVFLDYYPLFIFVFLSSAINASFFYFLKKNSLFFFKKKIIFVLIFLFFSSFFFVENKIFYFAKTIYQKNEVLDYYRVFYDSQKNLSKKRAEDFSKKDLSQDKFSSNLDNIIILQLESLNSDIVNPEIAPNLWQASRNEIFFDKVYANSVQTILSQENILCSMPTSLDGFLVGTDDLEEFFCLPRFFDKLGYSTAFFKTYNLNFADTGEFMERIGFDEIHADDIMMPEDLRYVWGWREDVFYKRVFESLKGRSKKNNFLYIEVGPTNHWPFNIPAEYTKKVPYPSPQNFKQKISNTIFLQDMHLQIALQEIEDFFPEKNYTLFIISDHSWPIGNKENNIFNQRGYFEENFLTSLAVINSPRMAEVSNQKISNMDIMPSVLDLFGLNNMNDDYRKSFFSFPDSQRVKILVQPYGNRYLSFINNNFKFVYNLADEKKIGFDLNEDPMENKAINFEYEVYSLSRTIPLFQNENIIMHAGGSYEGRDYTNSLEAFNYNYNRGRKLFEIDFYLTSEQEIVAWHEEPNLSFFDFKNKNSDLTFLSFSDFLDLMKNKQDFKIIIDTKKDFEKIIKKIYKEANKENISLDRFIPQIYSQDNLDYLVENNYIFTDIVYTNYKNKKNFEEIKNFFANNPEVGSLTIPKDEFNFEISEYCRKKNIKLFVHTVNNISELIDFYRKGVHGVYSDIF